MNCKEMTQQYFSRWLGSDGNLLAGTQNAPVFLFTPERNTVQAGYGERFDVWALETASGTFVSFGDAVRDSIPRLEEFLRGGTPLGQALQQAYGVRPEHSIRWFYAGDDRESPDARVLEPSDYPAFEQFFRSQYPDLEDVSWLREYFDEMAAEHLCCGVFMDGLLVSCTDMPIMPYMQESIREIGINTLAAYRGRGCAKAACLQCIHEVLSRGKCPIWSAEAENTASLRLAESVGFVRLGDSYSISLSTAG